MLSITFLKGQLGVGPINDARKMWVRNLLCFVVDKGPSINFFGLGRGPSARFCPTRYPTRNIYIYIFFFPSLMKRNLGRSEQKGPGTEPEPETGTTRTVCLGTESGTRTAGNRFPGTETGTILFC